MKPGVRALGIDDGPQAPETLLVGVVMRPDRLEGVLTRRVRLDGDDATAAIADMARSCRFGPQVRCIFLDGVAVAGFNVIDYSALARELSLPVVVCTPNEPHPDDFSAALDRWPEKRVAWERIRTPAYRLGSTWFQFAGCTRRGAGALIKQFRVHSGVPEPLRVAHLIAAGVELGESRGS
jgi:endonuclease V-like protein UPF0215 family